MFKKLQNLKTCLIEKIKNKIVKYTLENKIQNIQKHS